MINQLNTAPNTDKTSSETVEFGSGRSLCRPLESGSQYLERFRGSMPTAQLHSHALHDGIYGAFGDRQWVVPNLFQQLRT